MSKKSFEDDLRNHGAEQISHAMMMMTEIHSRTVRCVIDMQSITVFRELPDDLKMKVVALGITTAAAGLILEGWDESKSSAEKWLTQIMKQSIVASRLAKKHDCAPFELIRAGFERNWK